MNKQKCDKLIFYPTIDSQKNMIAYGKNIKKGTLQSRRAMIYSYLKMTIDYKTPQTFARI